MIWMGLKFGIGIVLGLCILAVIVAIPAALWNLFLGWRKLNDSDKNIDRTVPELDHPDLERRPWGDPDTWVPPERPIQ